MVSLGQGIRCMHEANKDYIKNDTNYKTTNWKNPQISSVPDGCDFYE